jgi:hypothetical protein
MPSRNRQKARVHNGFRLPGFLPLFYGRRLAEARRPRAVSGAPPTIPSRKSSPRQKRRQAAIMAQKIL